MGDERPHAARLGEGQRFSIVVATLCIEPVGMGRGVADQVQCMGHEPAMLRREFDHAVG